MILLIHPIENKIAYDIGVALLTAVVIIYVLSLFAGLYVSYKSHCDIKRLIKKNKVETKDEGQ